jgi:hypothetical protein
MNPLITLDVTHWNERQLPGIAAAATDALEDGKVLLMPQLKFELIAGEESLLDEKWLAAGAKNISYDPRVDSIGHTSATGADRASLTWMLARFAKQARQLATHLCVDYAPHLRDGLTSFRPAEVRGRETSPRKDDTRLHVDAFASRPTGGLRILRVFHNINPRGEPRVWDLGDPLPAVAQRYIDRVPPQLPGSAWLLERLGIVKGRRSEYDHIMLNLHDKSKLDEAHQRTSERTRVELPAHSTWMVYSDGVEHAVLAGQYLLEQTFYLPVTAMRDECKAPLRVLEQMKDRALA